MFFFNSDIFWVLLCLNVVLFCISEAGRTPLQCGEGPVLCGCLCSHWGFLCAGGGPFPEAPPVPPRSLYSRADPSSPAASAGPSSLETDLSRRPGPRPSLSSGSGPPQQTSAPSGHPRRGHGWFQWLRCGPEWLLGGLDDLTRAAAPSRGLAACGSSLCPSVKPRAEVISSTLSH